MQKEFELTEEQYDEIIKAIQPVPYIVIGGMAPLSQQERANNAWKALGDKLGFKYMTVRPVYGKSDRFFTAEVSDGS
jgi:hypothetical protein